MRAWINPYFDRQSLQRQYQITANPKPHWHTKTMFHDEAEEEIWVDVYVGKHLIAIVSEPRTGVSKNHKS